MANNGKLKLSDYDTTNCFEWELEKINKAIEKRLRRKQRERDSKKEKQSD